MESISIIKIANRHTKTLKHCTEIPRLIIYYANHVIIIFQLVVKELPNLIIIVFLFSKQRFGYYAT
jgi:hypothetical protein